MFKTRFDRLEKIGSLAPNPVKYHLIGQTFRFGRTDFVLSISKCSQTNYLVIELTPKMTSMSTNANFRDDRFFEKMPTILKGFGNLKGKKSVNS